MPHTQTACDLTPRILLVEDDTELREALAENLRLNGMSVVEAASGLAFHQALPGHRFDVVILDVNLPDTNGFQLARIVHAIPRRPGIILLTARTGQHDRIQGYTEGADLYMTKPVDGRELFLAVRNLATRVQHGRGQITSAAWQLDVVGKRLVTPEGTALALTSREVLLLEQFVLAEGKPVPHSTLTAIMGYGSPGPESRGLDAALRRLHEKAHAQDLRLPLQVIHAIGIRFTAPLALL